MNWIHEREWRLSESLVFDFSDIEYVIVNTVVDAATLVHHIGAARLPESKVLPMQVSEIIKSEWRTS